MRITAGGEILVVAPSLPVSQFRLAEEDVVCLADAETAPVAAALLGVSDRDDGGACVVSRMVRACVSFYTFLFLTVGR